MNSPIRISVTEEHKWNFAVLPSVPAIVLGAHSNAHKEGVVLILWVAGSFILIGISVYFLFGSISHNAFNIVMAHV